MTFIDWASASRGSCQVEGAVTAIGQDSTQARRAGCSKLVRRALVPAATAALFAGVIGTPAALAAPTLSNGYTAKVVAVSGEKISGAIDATGYDVGIYVGPGVHDVTITGATVSGANDQGVLVQDARNVLVTRSSVLNNDVDPNPSLAELKGVVVTGSTDVAVTENLVEGNKGGVGIYDDGPNSPFAPTAIDSTPVPEADNLVSRNVIKDNPGDCGIVVSAKNPGGGVMNNVVSFNTVLGFDPATGDTTLGLGGIVVAGGSFGPVPVTNTVVSHNTVTGGFLPGISIHAFGPGTITGTQLIANVLSDNGMGSVSGASTGVEIFAVPGVGVIGGTQILNDSVSNDSIGVFHVGDTATHISHLTTNDVSSAIVPPAAP
jgi:hypothetical protein